MERHWMGGSRANVKARNNQVENKIRAFFATQRMKKTDVNEVTEYDCKGYQQNSFDLMSLGGLPETPKKRKEPPENFDDEKEKKKAHLTTDVEHPDGTKELQTNNRTSTKEQQKGSQKGTPFDANFFQE
eukprot:TRINITY_DN11887_c0_g1_i1.p1 TRINITY_DN11887_c0_g1~~TRINITY_DN11887_c0_g1_i1.p1  ORF type:complete len:129 (+),score=43.98 TRINITY_DN11887_c0_g1_i1:93-479(+)